MVPNLKNKGFTILELLVVIAIIGLIASLIFGFITQARIKARSVAVAEQVRQYRTAIDQYVIDKERLIITSPLTICVGPPSAVCKASVITINGHPAFAEAFSSYIPGLPAITTGEITVGGTLLSGALYTCMSYELRDGENVCTSATFLWPQVGTQCTLGETSTDGTNSFCIMRFTAP